MDEEEKKGEEEEEEIWRGRCSWDGAEGTGRTGAKVK